MSCESLPANPELPQLAIAGDREQMRELFQRFLRPIAGRSYTINDCQLSRVRYRQGTRSVLQYTLRLVERETGCERSQCVTGVVYPSDPSDPDDRDGHLARKLRAGNPSALVPEAFQTFEPVSYIPELKMLVQVYPCDRRLSTLPLLMAGPPPELEPDLLAEFGPGDWQIQAWKTEPIQYRAGLSAVLRYTLQARDAVSGKTAERRFYAKVYRDDTEGEQTYQLLQALRAIANGRAAGFTVGRPVAYCARLRTLLHEEAPGTPLLQILLKGGDTDAAVRQVARALADFNQECVTTTRLHTFADQISHLERAGVRLRCVCPHLSEDIDQVIDAVKTGLDEAPPGPTHRDIKADHILLDGDRVVLIDLDSFAAADPVLDPALLLARLSAMPIRHLLPRGRFQTAARAFAEEYFARVPPAWRDRLALHFAGAALEVAVGFFGRQEPRWPETIAALVQEAKDALTGESQWY